MGNLYGGAVGIAQQPAPRVVIVARDDSPRRGCDGDDVALQVLYVVIIIAVIGKAVIPAVRAEHERELVAAALPAQKQVPCVNERCGGIAYLLRQPFAGCGIFVDYGLRALQPRDQPGAVPIHRFAAVDARHGVVVNDAAAVVRRKQIAPRGAAVGIRIGVKQRVGGIIVRIACNNIAAGNIPVRLLIRIYVSPVRARVDLLLQHIMLVVNI